ncbi:MAG: zinc-binding alcohol dehydrogenase [Gemmatimonadota bacterium]|nr:zinc-binding alcohol dehydrogenase [Gemmatimonadota bacterium]
MSEPIRTRAFWVRAPGRGDIVEETVPPRGEDEVLVEASYSGVSRGTEALVFRGEVPVSQYQEMRAPFQEGDFPGPVKYGYGSVGRVVDTPGEHESLLGRSVFCLFPHQDRYVVPVTALTLLPDGVPEGRGVLAANMETAINVVWDAGLSVGDRVIVLGGGVVGLLVTWLAARVPGVELLLVDPNPARAEIARAFGARFTTEVTREEPAADVVIHASGAPDGLRTALGSAGVEARIVEASWYGSRTVPLPLGEAFHSRRLTLRSSQVGRIPPDRAARWTHRRRLATAVALLDDPALDLLISGESPFEDLPGVMATLAAEGSGTLCHRIRYHDVERESR